MRLDSVTDAETGERTLTFTVSSADLVNVQLDPWDRRLLDEPEDQPADALLKAEMLARRIWEQNR